MHISSKFKPICGSILVTILTLSAAPVAYAAGHHGGGHGGGYGPGGVAAIGEPGKGADVSRTIEMVMTDNRYSHDSISVRKGETIQFKVMNKGEFVHEFNIGTVVMHTKHQKEMMMMFDHGVLEPDKIHHDKMKMKMPDGSTMAHNDPNSVLLEPGKSAEIIWKFSADARLEFACNLPGHYESGMAGKIKIQ